MTVVGKINSDNMWKLMEDLYPVHRCLCGPGFLESLERVSQDLPLKIGEYASGTEVFDWIIPKEFKVNEAWVEHEDGERVLDFADCNYHIWNHSQPFDGWMDRSELIENIATMPELPDAVPLRVHYYREGWGLAASENQVKSLRPGKYHVHIDTEHFDGHLRIGEHYLSGESKDEIMITSYLCHPMGANDNLSGVVVSVELFKLLASLPKRRYSYRLAIWPETIGAITYIASHPERLRNVVGGYVLHCVGDPGKIRYKKARTPNNIIDRSAMHVLKHRETEHEILEYCHAHLGPDACQFNAVGLRLPFATLMRAAPNEYAQYHSSADDMTYVRPGGLVDSLEMLWETVKTLEHSATYRGNFKVDPFLTRHDIYPFQHGAGVGRIGNEVAQAYYHLMGGVDGETDLLEIAERASLPISAFEPAVNDFLRKELMAAL